MGYPVRRYELVARALQKADVDASVLASGGPGWITDNEIADLVIESAARFYDITLDIVGPEVFAKEYFQDFGPNIQPPPVELPEDFYRLLSVHVCDENAAGGPAQPYRNFEPMEPVEPQGPQATELLNAPPGVGPFFYAIHKLRDPSTATYKDELRVWPYPVRDRLVRILYVPVFDRYAGDGDDTQYDGINGWDQWVVLDVAIAILTKEESDTSKLERERDRVEARMRSKSDKVNSHRARTPVDVRSAARGRDCRWPR